MPLTAVFLSVAACCSRTQTSPSPAAYGAATVALNNRQYFRGADLPDRLL